MHSTLSKTTTLVGVLWGACAASQAPSHAAPSPDLEPAAVETKVAAPLEGSGTPQPDAPPGGYGHHDTPWVGYRVYLDLENPEARETRLGADATHPGTPGAALAPCGPVEVYFERGSPELAAPAKATLNRFATCVKDVERVEVQEADGGTLDHVEPEPGPAATPSASLTQLRVKAVRGYLRTQAEPQNGKPRIDD